MVPAPTSRRLTRLALGSALALALTGGSLAATAAPAARGTDPASGAATTATGVDTSSVIVQLRGAPLSTSPSVDRGSDKRVDPAGQRTKNARAALAKERSALRTWLRTNAPRAVVTGQYDMALNALAVRLNGTSVDTLRTAPGVTHVGYQSTYRPLAHEDPDLARVDAQQGWTAAGATSVETEPPTWAGYGIQVGIVDSGIDAAHPCFDDAGFPRTTQQGDSRFTNDKVIVAEVFNNKAGSRGLTPEAIDSHGTHVAGTVGCNLHTPASVEGADITYDPSGVAPGAQLGNYNVFPGEVGSARSEDILNALQAAADDGMDVINMSLGGGAAGKQDLLTIATDNLDRAGIVVAVAAGNDGPGYGTVGSPGSAERALTAGASSVGHYVGTPISANGGIVSVAAVGDFPTPDADLTAPLGLVLDGTELGLACAGLPAASLDGEIALISRGACSFGTKVANAEAAGAVAVIIVNNVPGDPIAMATDPAFPSTIPAVMSPLDDREELMALDGKPVTIGSEKAYTQTGNDDILAGFSSWGPTDVSYRVKPDVVAPGVNVLSSVPLAYCDNEDGLGCWAFFQGTSMATPHLAGMAAVVLDAHPSWDAWQVRSAIINTAKQNAVLQTSAITVPETDVQKVGSGLADLDAAVDATVALSSPSTSFGAIASGSGKVLSSTVIVTNLTSDRQVLPVTVEDSTGAGNFTASPSSVTLAPGSSATVTITFSAGKQAMRGATQAILHLGGNTHAVLYAFVK